MEWKFLKKGELTHQNDIIKAIEFFVPIVNQEFNRTEANDFSVNYLKQLAPNLRAFVSEDGYILFAILPDYWGNLELNVLSFFIFENKRRNFAVLRRFFEFVFQKASQENVHQIVFGAHLGKSCRLNRFFIQQGFYPLSYIKTLS